MDDRPLEIQYATIVLIILGALLFFTGYQEFQFSLIITDPIHTIFATLMPVYGIFTFCASLIVWLQKSWASKLIAVVGIAACAAAVIFSYYLMIVILAPIYWVAINQLKPVDEQTDWHED